MRHRKAGRHLKRSSGHRRALYRNLMGQLFRHERITTTEAKARAIRPLAEGDGAALAGPVLPVARPLRILRL